MNKWEEALGVLINEADITYCESGHTPHSVTNAVNRLEELVKRATPMKPIFAWEYKCPNCNKFITNGRKWQCENYCDACGQAIDWSEEK